MIPAIARARAAAGAATTAPVEIIASGAIQHASAAAERARHEVATFGTLESIAVVVLLLVVFGSMRPLLLGVLTLSFAITAAFTVVRIVFGEVHILALVFGSSLIGSVIDYSIHFFADRFRDPTQWTPARPSATWGRRSCSVLRPRWSATGCWPRCRFRASKQIAVFCMTGLVSGCGCVLCLYPVLAQMRGKLPKVGSRIGHALDGVLARWRWTTPAIVAFVALAAVVAMGLVAFAGPGRRESTAAVAA